MSSDEAGPRTMTSRSILYGLYGRHVTNEIIREALHPY